MLDKHYEKGVGATGPQGKSSPSASPAESTRALQQMWAPKARLAGEHPGKGGIQGRVLDDSTCMKRAEAERGGGTALQLHARG